MCKNSSTDVQSLGEHIVAANNIFPEELGIKEETLEL